MSRLSLNIPSGRAPRQGLLAGFVPRLLSTIIWLAVLLMGAWIVLIFERFLAGR